MSNNDYKVLVLVITGVLALIVASPAMQRFLFFPQTEFFTELWLLGPEHIAQGFSYNITRDESYSVILEISNHLGICSYYSLQVRFRNLTQSESDSGLVPLYRFNVFVGDKEILELPVRFSFDYYYDISSSSVNFSNLILNGKSLNLEGYLITWNTEKSGFFGNLVFELWIYNDAAGSFQYYEQSVELKLNILV